MKQYSVAVVGATGMVGRTFLQVLEELNLPVSQYYLFSSARSAGTKLTLLGKEYVVEELTETSFDRGIDIALFSAGGSTSEKFAPIAAAKGCVVIDNSSAWRMDEKVPLVVPEVNPEDIKWNNGIIANPNCSTIQAMVPLKPLHDKYKIKRIIYSTYQAVSGAGVGGWNDLENGLKGEAPKKFNHPIANNCLPQIDSFLPNGYTKEEMKMVNETKKILHDDSIRITATTVRVPVFNSHSESINLEFEKPFDLDELRRDLENMPGCVVVDDIDNAVYPMPIDATGKNEVFVGRIRRDESVENGVNLWVVADNIRKGAAANAVQIAQKLIEYWQQEA
ncbi:MAG: aspartate-semialdehyde dehydrogenase [Ruminococcaceae bacterium]|nr:aspartate-semialdehyde dehydrogenase [Oscillospiraceae bacterium]